MWNSSLTSRILSPSNNYNRFFNPNVCHICKATQNLLEYPKCALVFYCNMSHMLHHQVEHKELCNTIIAASQRRNFRNTHGVNLETWPRFRWNNLRYIKNTLNRELNRDEEQVFLFAKSCLVCYSQRKIYRVCRKYFSVNACNKHNLSDVEHPCWQLQFCFNLNRYSMLKFDRNTNIWKEFICLNASAVHNMESFIDLCIEERNYFSKGVRECSKTDPIWTFLSDDFSGPLYATAIIKEREEILHHSYYRWILTGHV